MQQLNEPLTTQDLIDSLLGLRIEPKKSYWEKEAKVPLLFTDLNFTNLDEKDQYKKIISLQLNDGDPLSKMPINMLMVASTGWGKDRLVKNIIKLAYKLGYKILCIEPKSFEFYNMCYMGKGNIIAPDDKNDMITKIKCYTPWYLKEYVESKMPERHKITRYFASNIEDLTTVDAWIGLGITKNAASIVATAIKKGERNIKKILTLVQKYENLYHSSRDAAVASLDALQRFFNTEYKDIPLEKDWENNNVVIVDTHNHIGSDVFYSLGLLLDKVTQLGIKESNNNKLSKKLIIANDVSYFLGYKSYKLNNATPYNLAEHNFSNFQLNGRKWGCNTIAMVQDLNPDNITPRIVDGCTSKLIGSCENADSLYGKIPDKAYDLISNTNPEEGATLYFDEHRYIKQWVISSHRTNFQSGYAFHCTLGHGD